MADKENLIFRLYREALRIRMVEDAIASEYPKAEMKTPIHLYTGQEAIAAGTCLNLTPRDVLFAYYRSHGWYLAKGGNLERMMGELFGKSSGCSKGYGGSMHLIDLELGFQGTTALVAAAMAHAVGAAFAIQYRKQPHVAISVFGDGATEEGIFQESLMFASLRKLPAIFISENNGLATNTWIRERQPSVPIYKRAEGFGLPTAQVDGNDAVAVHAAVQEAVSRARSGEGPSFIECLTYRILEHCGPSSDVSVGFRTQREVDVWKKKDPIERLESQLGSDFDQERVLLRKTIENEIAAAFKSAREAPFPVSLTPEGYACL